MKKLFTGVLLICLSMFFVQAQTMSLEDTTSQVKTTSRVQTTIQVNNKVTIKSSSDLDFLLNAHYDKNKNCDLADGYRIQIINSSNREDVYAKKAEVYGSFSKFKGYIVYDQPYYKLRIGDFKTKLEARKFLEEVIPVFSTAFIVRDEIKIN